MPFYVIESLREELDIRFAKGLRDTRVLIVGLAYKKNVDDLRESPALVIFELLKNKQAIVDFTDSHISTIPNIKEHQSLSGLKSISLTKEKLLTYDAVVICTDHDDIDYDLIVNNSRLIIDTRNAVKGDLTGKDHVVRA